MTVKTNYLPTERFPEIQVECDNLGVKEKFGNLGQARITFTQALRKRGYHPIGNRTWVKPGFAAVIAP